jgi:hypothetical protein
MAGIVLKTMPKQIQQLTSNIVQPLPSNIRREILCYPINIVGIYEKQFKQLVMKDIIHGIQAAQDSHNTMLLENCILYIYHMSVFVLYFVSIYISTVRIDTIDQRL